ncbi:MAG: sulfurtransferase-like selenium metabolism protein YedF [Desulfobacterium sp.]|jgi:selenium metabolism protein YedF|nr:sulfurtransferase-like selenium metabolism protein YedF [Desulfobacterium sp.]
MTISIDGRGLACPGPVLRTKEAVDTQNPGHISVTVDNDAAAENVSRFLTHSGFEVSVDSDGRTSVIEGTRQGGYLPGQGSTSPSPGPDMGRSEHQKVMVMIASRTIGRGDDILGEKLMTSFLTTLKEMGEDLWRVVFVNSGVKFTIQGSPVLDQIQELEGQGVHILVCGTCLTHFDILDQKKVGETTNMLDIVTSMQLAHKVINL